MKTLNELKAELENAKNLVAELEAQIKAEEAKEQEPLAMVSIHTEEVSADKCKYIATYENGDTAVIRKGKKGMNFVQVSNNYRTMKQEANQWSKVNKFEGYAYVLEITEA